MSSATVDRLPPLALSFDGNRSETAAVTADQSNDPIRTERILQGGSAPAGSALATIRLATSTGSSSNAWVAGDSPATLGADIKRPPSDSADHRTSAGRGPSVRDDLGRKASREHSHSWGKCGQQRVADRIGVVD